MPEALTKAQAANLLGYASERSIDRLIRRGELRIVKIGRRTRIERTEIERFLAVRRVAPGAPCP